MNIDLNNVNEKSSTGKVYMRPGIREVEIVSFEKRENKNGTYSIVGTVTDIATDAVHEEYFPCSETVSAGKEKSPFDITLIKLRHIARAAGGEDILTNLKGETLDEFVTSLNENLTGLIYRQKFTGEERMSMNNRKYAVARIPLPNDSNPMAESTDVAIGNSTLRYDQNDTRDFKPYVEFGINDFMNANPFGQ